MSALETRLKELYSHVDKFVLVEADTTYDGTSKNLNYDENKGDFSTWSDKIVHVSGTLTHNTNAGRLSVAQDSHYSLIKDKLATMSLSSTDQIMISDAPEIPDMSKISDSHFTQTSTCAQYFYEYDINHLLRDDWGGTILTNWSKVQSDGITALRGAKGRFFGVRSGWRLSSFEAAADVYYDFSHNYASFIRHIYNGRYRIKTLTTTLEKVTENITDGIHSGTVDESKALEVISSHAAGSIPPTLVS